MRVLAVDPGTLCVGFAVVDETSGRRSVVESGTIRAPRGKPLPERLQVIYLRLCEVIAAHEPEEMAVEGIFVGKNVSSTIRIGEGRAVALLAAAQAGMEVSEYAPRLVKKSTVGHGGAHKSQVVKMVQAALDLTRKPGSDEADAMAIGITHLNRRFLVHTKQAMEGST